MKEQRVSIAVITNGLSTKPVFVVAVLADANKLSDAVQSRERVDFKEVGLMSGGYMKGFAAFQYELYNMIDMWFDAWIDALTYLENILQIQEGCAWEKSAMTTH
jgi:hypothetical protein